MVNLLKETSFNNFVYKKYEGTTIEEQKKRYERLDQGKNEKEIEKRAPVDVPIYFYHPDHLGTTNALTDVNGNMYQFFLNLPFGETMAEQTSISYYQTEFKFNGKELDSETGMYYYGARYYDPSLSIWMSVDPLAEKYYSHSSYAYVMNSPIRYTDPTGMSHNDVILNGDMSDKYVEQLNASSSLTITRNEETGKLNAVGKAETKADRKLMKAISSEKVTVNINATSKNTSKDGGNLYGGSFDGSTKNSDGTVDAYQTVNPNHTEQIETLAGAQKGVIALHETLEAYFGARQSPGANGPVNSSSSRSDQRKYKRAHKKANRIDRRINRVYQMTTPNVNQRPGSEGNTSEYRVSVFKRDLSDAVLLYSITKKR